VVLDVFALLHFGREEQGEKVLMWVNLVEFELTFTS